MSELPSGTVTFLFTDLEGSTRLWQEHPEAMRPALARHDEIIRDAIGSHDGVIVKTTGDGAHAVFGDASDAIAAAVAAQVALAAEAWSLPEPLRVRMGVHSGPAELREGDYYGTSVNRAARIMSVAHGGQIVVSAATSELVRDTPVELVDLGEHRLRDLGLPERMFQVVGEGLGREFAPIRSLEAYATNLPAQRTSFVGRGTELHGVRKALAETRLVTLTGVGGVGKTRLAIQTAADLLPSFADGAWLVELAPVRDPEQVAAAVAEVLDVSPASGRTLVARIAEVLHRRRLLLVLDNCEHVLDAVAILADTLLDGCPDVAVLATSREGLGLAGERIMAVRSLELPDAHADLAAAASTAAVRLFVDRANAVVEEFVVNDQNNAAVVEICRRVDGVPLGIELAAARVRSLSPVQIAQRLDERFALLTGGGRARVERHQTLRATIDWSYELLDKPERAALRRLAVFRGGCDLDAAEAVLAGPELAPADVLDAVTSLADKSLVVVDRDDEQVRYRLLEIIREYAEEQLDEAGELAATRDRHADHFAAFAREAIPNLQGRDDAHWTARMDRDFDNVSAGVVWTGTHGDVETALDLVADLFVCFFTSRFRALGTLYETAAGFEGISACRAFPRLLGSLLHWQSTTTNFDPAVLERALDPLLAVVESRAEAVDAIVGYQICSAYLVLGRLDDAVAWGERAAARARAETDDWRLVWALVGLAGALSMRGPLHAGAAAAEECLAVARRLGNRAGIAQALCMRGIALRDEDPESALACFDEALTLAETLGPSMMLESALHHVGELRAGLGELSEAATALARALDMWEERGEAAFGPAIFLSVASAVAAAGDPEAAARILGSGPRYTGPTADEYTRALRTRLEVELGIDRFTDLFAEGSALEEQQALDQARAAIAAFPAS